jgi:hypothetical protein
MAGIKAKGGAVRGAVKLSLAGFTPDDLASSAAGTLSFDWRKGAISAQGPDAAALAHFDRWTAEAKIADSALTLGENHIRYGAKIARAEGSVHFADAPEFVFTAERPQTASR